MAKAAQSPQDALVAFASELPTVELPNNVPNPLSVNIESDSILGNIIVKAGTSFDSVTLPSGRVVWNMTVPAATA